MQWQGQSDAQLKEYLDE
ncbi:MAG: hypothetical protein ACPF8V_05150, partial [Luteibaculum sp.]